MKKIKCEACGTITYGNEKAVEEALMGVAVYCPGCTKQQPHKTVEDSAEESHDEAADLLDRHIEETYGEEVYCLYPTGHANAVLGTRMTDEIVHRVTCRTCGYQGSFTEKQAKWIASHEEKVCNGCKDKTKHLVEEVPAVQAIISEQRILENLEREFEDSEDPHLAAREWYDFNIACAYMGPGTPLYVEEVTNDQNNR